MDHDKVILDFLVTNFGTIGSSKSDGRVEIPQSFIQTMGWGDCDKLYMSYDDGAEIYISEDLSFHEGDMVLVEVAVTKGRVRIPARFLKQIGMSNKTLVFMEADGAAVVRIENSGNEERIVEFINTLDYDSIKQLAGLLMDVEAFEEDVEPEKSPELEIPYGEIARVLMAKPELILLSTSTSTVFRPVGDPYKFTAYWKDKEIVFCKSDMVDKQPSRLYLVPGIQRIKREDGAFKFGFLLMDETLFAKVCQRLVKSANRETAEGVEIIFIHNAFTYGSFKLYENPSEELEPEIIVKAKNVCSNPEQFLLQTFTLIDSKLNASNPPGSVNLNTVKITK